MNPEAGRFGRKRDDADVDGAVFNFLDDLAAEIPVDVNLNAGIAAVIFSEQIGEKVEASSLVRSDIQGALGRDRKIGDRAERFFFQSQEALGVNDQSLACRR